MVVFDGVKGAFEAMMAGKLNGSVEAWFEDLGDDPPVAKA